MFDILGSWLDWKKSEISAAVSNAAFNHQYKKMEKDYKKNPSPYNKKSQENKPEIKESSNIEEEVKEENPDTSAKSQNIEKDVTETENVFSESFDKILKDSKNLDSVMDDGLKDIVESINKYQKKQEQAAASVNVPADPAEQEHPEEDAPAENESNDSEKRIIDLRSLDSKKLLDVIYQVTLNNASELLKHTVADNENISNEERAKRGKEFDALLLPLLAKAITGLNDVSNVDMSMLETSLNDKLGSDLSGTIQSAFTVFVQQNQVPDGKPLDLTKNAPMEIVEDPSSESSTQSASNTSSTRRSSRRKK